MKREVGSGKYEIDYNTQIMKLKNLLILFFFSHFSYFLHAQNKYVVSGYVKDSISGETLISVNIINRKEQKVVTTNNYGYYTYISHNDEIELTFSYIGYLPKKIHLHLRADTTINVKLLQQNEIEEIIVSDKENNFVMQSDYNGGYLLNLNGSRKQPVVFGEADIMKSIQNIAGIQGGKEGTAGLYVRGGSPDQNLILLDGVPIYNVNHLFGFFSVFNSDAVNSVKIYKEGMPARYGGRLTSVVDIYMKEGNLNKLKVNTTLGLIASKITIEAPIVKSKSSFMLSVRRSYIDLLLKPFGDDNSMLNNYRFYDICAKFNYSFTDKSKLFLSVYAGKDKSKDEKTREYEDKQKIFKYTETDEFAWGNNAIVLRWNYLLSSNLFSNITAAYNKYDYYYNDNHIAAINNALSHNISNIEYLSETKSGITDYMIKQQLDYNLFNHKFKFGTQFTRHSFRPTSSLKKINNPLFPDLNIDTIYNTQIINANHLQAYIEDQINLFSNLSLNLGVHYSVFFYENMVNHSIEPRILANYSFNKFGLKASYTNSSQNIHLLTNPSMGMPTDLWLPSTDKVKLQKANHYNIGFYTGFSQFNFGIDIYYREMRNLTEYKEGVFYGLEVNNWQNFVEQGEGKTYGIDYFAKYRKDKLYIYLAYSLSKSLRTFKNISYGKEYPYRYDRPHNLTIIGKYDINKNISFSATWTYMSGEAISLGTRKALSAFLLNSEHYRGTYTIPFVDNSPNKEKLSELIYNRPYSELQIPYYKHRNNYRIPAYHRLDIALVFSKQKKRFFRTFTVGVYNVYNKQNPFYYYFDKDRWKHTIMQKAKLKQVTLFPVLPYVSYGIKF